MKKRAVKKRVVKRAKKTTTKRKAATIHTDKNSHNVKISIVSGIKKNKSELIDKLRLHYGNLSTSLLDKKPHGREYNATVKQMREVRKEIAALKKSNLNQ